MTGSPASTALESSLLARMRGLDARLEGLRRIDRRFSWYRLGTLLLGVAFVAAADLLIGGRLWVWAAALAVLAFLGVVALHRRVENAIRCTLVWRELRQSQLARMTLDWEHVPPAQAAPEGRSPLDIDLDLNGPRSLHHLLDGCVSEEGSRLLAAWLASGAPDVAEVEMRQAVVGELSRLPRFRDRLYLRFRSVSRASLASRWRLRGEGLLDWLRVDMPQEKLLRLMVIGILLAALNLTLFLLALAGVLPAYWPFSLALYAIFYFSNANAIGEFLEALVELNGSLEKFRPLLDYLEHYNYGKNSRLAALCAPFREGNTLPSAWLRQVRWVTAGIGVRTNPVLGLLLNLALPWDFAFAYLAGRLRGGAENRLDLWLRTWARLDALISLAGFAALHPQAGYPKIDTESKPVFLARGLRHPLIPEGRSVGNDFSLGALGEVVVITGSNMAGKSTFLKTVGINLCLAYAGAPVLASELRTRPFRLHTCMRITDSITDGFSYFYAEVKCLRSLLDRLRQDDPLPLLYLIDEIFRGTNNRERLAGSRAYTRSLAGAHGVGLIATHDLELAHLAEQDGVVRNFHFEDQVAEGRLAFDYRLRPGPSTTTNALRIMEMEGLPVEGE